MIYLLLALSASVVLLGVWVAVLQVAVTRTLRYDGKLWELQQKFNDKVDEDVNRLLDRNRTS